MKRVVEICCKAAVGAVALLMTGCCPCRNMVAEREVQDSVRTVYRERTVHVPDTVYLEIPLQSAERTTKDSLSHLENEFAVSEARITGEGLLFHSLETKAQRKPIVTEREIVTRDSIVYKDRYITATKTVEVERRLSVFQKVQMWGFWVLAALAVGIVILRVKK
jgi:hypothetical protein